MKVIVKKPFTIVRKDASRIVIDQAGFPVQARADGPVVLLDFAGDCPLAMTPEELYLRIDSGHIEAVCD